MSETVKVEEEQSARKGFMLFGVDILKIECFRGALLNGYIGAAIGGLGGFIYTSSMRIASHSAFGFYWIFAVSSWISCRYQKYKREKGWENLKQMVNEERKAKEGKYRLPSSLMVPEEVVEEESTEKS